MSKPVAKFIRKNIFVDSIEIENNIHYILYKAGTEFYKVETTPEHIQALLGINRKHIKTTEKDKIIIKF
jgi:hypothetical protein